MALRLFVALAPPPAVHERLAAIQADMKERAGRASSEVKWVDPANVHLTVQFLGAVAEERAPDVAAAVRDAARASRPLALEVRGAGGFPNARRPRVLWAGLEGDLDALAALAADLGARLAPLGFPPEARAFRAHLTLGRARDPRGARGLADVLAAVAGAEGGAWRAEDLVLFRSHLSPKGPRYEALERAPLGG